MFQECGERGWEAAIMYRSHDSMITRARDVLFSMFLETDCTDLFFIDDDIGCRPGSFARLMEHPVDVVGGAYRGRKDPEEYAIRPLPSGIMQFDPETKLMEVEAVATGFLRITRAAAEQVAAADPDAWYTDSTAPAGLKIRSVFDNYLDREKHQKWSEDYFFCRRYRETGGKVWVDPVLELDHTGTKTFTGCLFDYLKRMRAEQERNRPMTLLGAAKGLLAEADKAGEAA